MNAVIRAKRDLIFSVSVFGTIGIFVRWIGLPSSVIALVRGAVGAAFLLLLARFRHAPIDRAALRRRWQLLLLSAAMMSFNWITLFEAYRYTTVATATLCYYMAPIFVTLISPVLLKERLTARKLLCVFLACSLRWLVWYLSPACRSPACRGRLRQRAFCWLSAPPHCTLG